MSKLGDMPAFASVTNIRKGYHVYRNDGMATQKDIIETTGGLTIRQHYAGLAMQGLCANSDLSKYAFDQGFKSDTIRKDYARSAVHCADALIAELEKEAP